MSTLYASSLQLNAKDFKALKMKDFYSIHRVIYSLFDDVRTDAQKTQSVTSGIQWVDKGGDNYHKKFLMLSNRIPKKKIDDSYGIVEYKSLPENFLNFKDYRFEVVVNPTTRNSNTRKLIPVKGRDAIADWFANRAENQWGFKTTNLQIDDITVQQFKSKSNITLQQAKVTGLLNVINPEQFTKSFTLGIGRGRSFGCGLLQIVPLT